MTPAEYFSHWRKLLALEAAAELERQRQWAAGDAREAERRGVCLTGLALRDENPGLAGRTILTLGKRDQRAQLPWTRLSVGSPVVLLEEQARDPQPYRGTVCGKTRDTIDVAVPHLVEATGDRPLWRLQLAADEVARQRQTDALRLAERQDRGRLAALRDVLLGERPPRVRAAGDWQPRDTGLNTSQIAAITHALAAEDVAIIHGPPCSGQTRSVVDMIRQSIARGAKVLACAPSNLAVDNLVERLDWAGERVVRLGHPARVLPQLRARTLDVLVDEHPDVALARRLLKEADQLRHQAAKFTRAKPPPGHKQELRQEAAALRADARRMEQQVVDYLLDSATVIAATLSGLPAELLGERRFDLLVIDEASQATEPACWPALVRAERVVFAGDHCQLPPTVLSNQAAKEGLTKSAMERLTERKDAELAQLLTVQYRMHAQIMRFSSDEFYQGRLTADATVAAHSLADLFPAESEPLFQLPLEFLDTAGSGCDEVPAADGQSLTNPGEGAIAVRKVQRLAQAGLPAADIALITPYAAQARWLEERLANDEVEVDTVDGFQGREKEAVIVSLVRSNPRGEIGFLGELRRLNVAFTRAKRKLLIIGDSATLAGEPFFQRLIAHVEACGGYRTIWEEPELND